MLTCVAKHIVKTIKQATKLYIMLLFFAILNVAQASEVKFSQTPTKAEIFLPLSNNVDYEIESRDNIIQLSFSQPLSKDLRETKKNLNLFIKEQDISSDQKSIRLETKLPHTIRTGNENDILHIEIGLPQENNLTSGANGHKIISEYGQHKDYDRISFAYNKKPQYAVKAAQDNTIISFINPVEIDWSKVQNKNIYPYIEQTSNKLGGIDIKFPGKLLKSFEYQNKIVLDFLPKAVINVPQEQYLRSANITQSQNTIANAKDEVQNSINKEKVSSLAFPWNMEVGVSVFQRGKYIWVAFDHSQNIDLADLRRQSKDVAEEIIQLPHSQALILRITPKKNVKVGLRQEGLLWIIDLYTHNIAYKGKELPIFLQYNSMNQSYLYIPSISIGNALSIIDPEIGDVIYIGTETELGLSVNEDYHYPDLEILPAKQGFAIVPNSSDIIVSKGNTGFSIKGNNRGLNISDNLENLKRQQQLWEKTSEVFDLNIPAQILNLDFNTAENQLKEDISKASPEQEVKAKLALIRYYLGMGLGSEALRSIKQLTPEERRQIKPETLSALSGVANFLLRRYDDALDNFSQEALQNNNEAIFWRALTDSAIEFKKENDAVLLTFISIIRNYPQELKERIALVAVDTSIQSYDDISTQNFMDILKFSKVSDARRSQILYLNAKKFSLQGYPNNAIREYGNATRHQSQKYASLSRYEKANIELKLSLLKPKKAIEELERLRFAWGAPEFKLILLQRLAEVYEMDRNFSKAMQTYEESMSVAETQQQKDEILNKMIQLFENLYLNGVIDELQAVKAIALYKDYEWLAPRSRHFTDIIQKVADRMVAVDLLTSASELLKEQLRVVNLSEEQKSEIGIRLALIYLFERDSIAALDILEKTDSQNLPENHIQYRKIIKAKALSNLKRNEEALELLEGNYSKNALLLKTDIYWKSGKWEKAADSIKYLIEKPKKDQALTQEQISYILDWITALKKANQDTVIFRIRNTFLPHFQGTPYYSTFNVLTTNLETNRVDMNAIDKAVNDIQAYSDFSKLYDDSLLKNLPKQPKK